MSEQPTQVVGRRVVAWIVDLVPMAVLFVVGVRLFGEARGSTFFDDDLQSGFDSGASITASLSFGDRDYVAENGAAAKVYLLVAAWGVLNSVLLQGSTGASVGKALVGLRVVRPDGRLCGTGKALVRWLLLVVDAFPFFAPIVGFVMVLSTKGNRRLGDMAADTYVVAARSVGRPVQVGSALAHAPGAYGSPTPPPGEPVWDPARNAWVRWDGAGWVQHDPASNTWSPLR